MSSSRDAIFSRKAGYNGSPVMSALCCSDQIFVLPVARPSLDVVYPCGSWCPPASFILNHPLQYVPLNSFLSDDVSQKCWCVFLYRSWGSKLVWLGSFEWADEAMSPPCTLCTLYTMYLVHYVLCTLCTLYITKNISHTTFHTAFRVVRKLAWTTINASCFTYYIKHTQPNFWY